jgi:hypothetical protein
MKKLKREDAELRLLGTYVVHGGDEILGLVVEVAHPSLLVLQDQSDPLTAHTTNID